MEPRRRTRRRLSARRLTNGRRSQYVLGRTLTKQGRVELEIWEYGVGQTKKFASHTPYRFVLNSREGLKARAFRRNYQAHEVKVGFVIVSKQLDCDGRFQITQEVRGLVAGSRALAAYRIVWESQTGLVRKVGLDRASSLAGLSWKRSEEPVAGERSLEKTLARERTVRGEVHFNRALSRLDKPLDFTFSFYVVNGDAMSDWEFELLYPPDKRRAPTGETQAEPQEWLAYVVWHPVEHLTLRAELPPTIKEIPYVDVYCDPTLARENLVEGSVLRPPETKWDHWERDPYMRDGEEPNLRRIGENVWCLEVDHPPMGYLYSINWFLPTTTRGAIPGNLVEEARSFRRILVRYREQRLRQDGPTDPRLEAVRRSFALYYELFRRHFPCIDPQERFDVSLMTYDEDKRRIVLVEGLMNGKELPSSYWNFWLPPGVGNAGTCFKTGESRCYLATDVLPEFNYYLAVEEEQSNQHQVLVSIPLDHPKFHLPPAKAIPSERKRQVVGVLNLGSNCASSTLRRLFPDGTKGRPERTEEMGKLQGICQSVLNEIWDILVVVGLDMNGART